MLVLCSRGEGATQPRASGGLVGASSAPTPGAPSTSAAEPEAGDDGAVPPRRAAITHPRACSVTQPGPSNGGEATIPAPEKGLSQATCSGGARSADRNAGHRAP
eukprot:scaffold7929_cov106-Isochrysis_galbana.AAC.3